MFVQKFERIQPETVRTDSVEDSQHLHRFLYTENPAQIPEFTLGVPSTSWEDKKSIPVFLSVIEIKWKALCFPETEAEEKAASELVS